MHSPTIDIRKEIQRMAAFMDVETDERVEEIESKTMEECNMCAQMALAEQFRINAQFKKLEKQVEKKFIVDQSKVVNQARLKILQLKEKALEDLFIRLRELVINNLNDKTLYKSTMKKLILQACVKLLVPMVLVRVKRNDVAIATSVLNDVKHEYTNITNLQLQASVDSKTFLPESTIGGAEIYDRRGKCKVGNTLLFRLKLIQTLMMPVVRDEMFGANPRRHFFE